MFHVYQFKVYARVRDIYRLINTDIPSVTNHTVDYGKMHTDMLADWLTSCGRSDKFISYDLVMYR